MQLASVLTPMSDENLSLAAQCGVTEIVAGYAGPTLQDFVALKKRIESFGMRLTVIEGYLPIEKIKLNQDDGRELDAMKALVRQMGEAQIPILCYNFMPGTDWVRTRLDVPERGGAKVTRFDLREVDEAVSFNHDASDSTAVSSSPKISEQQLWQNLSEFIAAIIPVAEQAGVALSMHPDDPPLPQFQNSARIMNRLENFQRLVQLYPSKANGICFCQGNFAAMGVDIPSAIRQLGPHINFVHFRDVRGTPESFTETFHDNGPTDMAATIRAYKEIGFNGPIRPDHVPQLFGEDDGEPGYTMKGRLFAFGYIRGLIDATT